MGCFVDRSALRLSPWELSGRGRSEGAEIALVHSSVDGVSLPVTRMVGEWQRYGYGGPSGGCHDKQEEHHAHLPTTPTG
jgi:hypothetical protein